MHNFEFNPVNDTQESTPAKPVDLAVKKEEAQLRSERARTNGRFEEVERTVGALIDQLNGQNIDGLKLTSTRIGAKIEFPGGKLFVHLDAQGCTGVELYDGDQYHQLILENGKVDANSFAGMVGGIPSDKTSADTMGAIMHTVGVIQERVKGAEIQEARIAEFQGQAAKFVDELMTCRLDNNCSIKKNGPFTLVSLDNGSQRLHLTMNDGQCVSAECYTEAYSRIIFEDGQLQSLTTTLEDGFPGEDTNEDALNNIAQVMQSFSQDYFNA